MRIIALLAVYNEERFLANTIRHLAAQGVESYVVDNGSTDRTRAIADTLRGHGVVGIEDLPRRDVFEWGTILRRKEELHCELGAHWYIHQDADMVLQAPNPYATLAEAIEAVDRAGDNAIDFDEFIFMPRGPDDDHDNERYFEEMHHYVHLAAPLPCFRVIAWKNQGHRIWLDGGGHWVSFHGRRVHAQRFILRHYLALSAAHARRKYDRRYLESELRLEWHQKRATLRDAPLRFPQPEHLKMVAADNHWDRSSPVPEEPLFAAAATPKASLPTTTQRMKRTLRRRAGALLRRFPSLYGALHRAPSSDYRVTLLPPRDAQRPLHNLLILGSGRSGTSMVAALFRDAGYFMGFDLLSASPANPYGYYEDTGITEINNLLLRWMLPWWLVRVLPGIAPAAHRDARSLWLAAPRRTRSRGQLIAPLVRLMNAYARQQPFCFKDPRFSVTLPLWDRFLPFGTRRIVVFRDPDQTVDSILRDAQETYSPPLPVSRRWAYLSWWRNYSRLLQTVDRRGPAVFVNYDDVATEAALPMLARFTNASLNTRQIDPPASRATAIASSLSIAHRCRALYARLLERSAADRLRSD